MDLYLIKNKGEPKLTFGDRQRHHIQSTLIMERRSRCFQTISKTILLYPKYTVYSDINRVNKDSNTYSVFNVVLFLLIWTFINHLSIALQTGKMEVGVKLSLNNVSTSLRKYQTDL